MKLPPLADNLFRDLRDKRLLPIVGLLLVLLIAIPFLLGGGNSPAPGSPVAGSAALGDADGEAPETQPVVLADVPGIRDYRKRLNDFNRKNPFRQQLTGLSGKAARQAAADGEITEDSAPASPGGATAATSSGDDSSTDGGDPSVAESGGGSTGQTGAPGGSGDTSSGGGGDKSSGSSPRDFLVTYEIDVQVGLAGETEKRTGVKQGKFLPGKKTPVVLFLDGNEADGSAFFIVSRDVTSSTGDGNCTPNRSNCQYLKMKKGDEQTFEYDGRTYKLKLDAVTLVKKPLKREALRGDSNAALERPSPLAGLFGSGS